MSIRYVFWALLVLSVDVFAVQVEITGDSVPILAEAQPTATVLTTLAKGQKLEGRDRVGIYWEVKLKDGRSGFVNSSSVKLAKEERSSFSQNMRNSLQSSRNEEDPADMRYRTVVGTRGLQDGKEVSAIGNSPPNFRLIFLMESLRISNSHIEEIGKDVQQEIASKKK